MGSNDFDHIINEKLSNASATPPSHILENLKFDRMAKQKMANAEVAPPAHVWDKIAAVILPKKRIFFTRARVAAIALLLISVLSLPLFLSKDNQQQSETSTTMKSPSSTESKSSQNISKKSSSKTVLVDTMQDEEKNVTTESFSTKDDNSIVFSTDNQIDNTEETLPNNTPTEDVQLENVVENLVQKEETTISQQEAPDAEQPIDETPEQSSSISEHNKTEIAVVEVPSQVTEDLAIENAEDNSNSSDNSGVDGNPIKGTIKPNPRNIQQFSISLRYAPDLMTVNAKQYYRHGLDLGFNYQNRNFILETGIGGQYTNTNTEYTFNYWDHNHFMGTYDSIVAGVPTSDSTFSASHTESINIYDTVNLSYTERAYEHYANIRIPLLVGYQKDFRDYSLFVKGGVMYNLNVYQKTTNINEPTNISELIEFDYPSKQIYKSQLEYMLSVGGNMDLTRHLKFTGELTGRMSHFGYFREQKHKGYAIGARVGLLYEW